MKVLGLVLGVLFLAVSVASRNPPPTFPGGRTGRARPETNRYIVEFDEAEGSGRRLSSGDRRAACQASGAAVVSDLPMIHSTVVHASWRQRRNLGRQSHVRRVILDRPRYVQGFVDEPVLSRKLQSCDSEQTPYGVNLHGGIFGHDSPLERKKVCIIDSGYAIDHEDLYGAERVESTQSSAFTDLCGHGTHVAGTITAITGNGVGVTSQGDSDLIIVKVFSGAGCGWSWSSSLAEAVAECRNQGASVISMSLGGGGPNEFEEEAMDAAVEAGILVVAAAGNSGNTAYSYPASYPSVMSVAAIDSSKNQASFSQYNDQVDIAAAGVQLPSTYLNGGYASLSGTSMATPTISGCAAMLMRLYGVTGPEAREAIELTAEDLGTSGRDNRYGHGMMRCRAAAEYLDGATCDASTAASAVVSGPAGSVDCGAGVSVDVTINSGYTGAGCADQAYTFVASSSAADGFSIADAPSSSNLHRTSYSLNILSDNYPTETSWVARSAGVTVFSGSLGNDGEFNAAYDNVLVGESMEFIMSDSYGDGICCSYGNGQYELRDVNNDIVASGGEFGSSDSTCLSTVGSLAGVASGPVSVASTTTKTVQIQFPAAHFGATTVDITVWDPTDAVIHTESVQFTCSSATEPPLSPAGTLSVTAVTASSVSLSWDDVTDATRSSWTIRHGALLATAVTVDAAATTAEITGLTANTEYTFTLVATNGFSDSTASIAATQTTRVAAPVLTVSGFTQTTVDLSWSAVSGAATYILERADGAAGSAFAVIESGITATTAQDATVTAATAYRYRLTAADAGGLESAASEEVEVTTLMVPPADPASFTGAPLTDTSAKLTWDAATDNAGYILSRVVKGTASPVTEVTIAAGEVEYIDEGLTPETTYSYSMYAFNEDGTRSGDATAEFTMPEACVAADPTVGSAQTEYSVDCILGGSVVVEVDTVNEDTASCPDDTFTTVATVESADSERGFGVEFDSGAAIVGSATGTLTITIKTDRRPRQTWYRLTDASGAATSYRLSDLEDSLHRFKRYTYEHPLPDAAGPWTFELLDDGYNGLCCRHGRGGDLDLVFPDGTRKEFSKRQMKFGRSLSVDVPLSGIPATSDGWHTDEVMIGDSPSRSELTVTFPADSLAAGTATTVTLGAYRGPYSAGTTPATTTALTFTCAFPSPPPVPSLSTTVIRGITTMGLSWNDVADETGYEIGFRLASATEWGATDSVSFDADVTSGDISGLSAATEYTFRIRSVGTGGAVSDWDSAVVTATTKPNPPSTADAFDAVEASSAIELTWTYTGAEPVDSWVILRGVTGPTPSVATELVELPNTDDAVRSYTDEDSIAPETTYSYSLIGRNEGGDTAVPATAEVTTVPVCVFATPDLEVTVTAPEDNLPCGKRRLYTVDLEITSNHHEICGDVAFTTGVPTAGSLLADHFGCNTFDLVLDADAYPDEFSFSVHDGSDASGQVLAAGAGAGMEGAVLCPSSGSVFFNLVDSGLDGICCTYGNGGYTIKQEGVAVVQRTSSSNPWQDGSSTHELEISLRSSLSIGGGDTETVSFQVGTTGATTGDVDFDAVSSGQSATDTATFGTTCASPP